MRTLLALPFVVLASCAIGACDASHDGVPPARDPNAGPIDGAACDGAAAKDIAVANDDRDGYAPYALDACSLAYLSHTGDLVLRDLAARADEIIAPSADRPRRPALAIGEDGANPIVAWEATVAGKSIVRVLHDGKVATIDGPFVSAGEPRARSHHVVFTAWTGPSAGDDTDVWLYDTRTKSARLLLGGPGQQRFADVSSTHVVATDFSEDPDGRYDGVSDLADLVVYDLATGIATPRPAPGKQAFPMLGTSASGAVLAYLEWGLVHPEPKLEAYVLRAGMLASDPATYRTVAEVKDLAAPSRPSLAGNTIEWVANPGGRTALYRAPIDGATAPVEVSGLEGLSLYAPVSNAQFTVLGAVGSSAADRTPRLRTVAR